MAAVELRWRGDGIPVFTPLGRSGGCRFWRLLEVLRPVDGSWMREGRCFLCLREGKDCRCLAGRDSRDEEVLSGLFLFGGLGWRLLLGFG